MTAFSENRVGRVLLSEAFVTGERSVDVFKNFSILLAMPRYNEPGIIAYYGAHPDFEPFDGGAKDSPYYDPYWNDDGVYFKLHEEGPPVNIGSLEYARFLNEVDRLMMNEFGMTHFDAEDYNWKDEFDSEVPAEEAFEEWNAHTEGGTRSPANF